MTGKQSKAKARTSTPGKEKSHLDIVKALGAAQEALDEKLNELYEDAEAVVSEFWSWVLQNNSRQDKKEKNSLGLRVRRTATGVSIQWYNNRWYKDDHGNWKPISQYIRKGRRTTSYRNSALSKHIKPWQEDKVWETEDRLAEIRKRVQQVTDLRKATGMLKKRYEDAGDIL